MCECPCMLRPFFGQCIFNIIFAASAYPLQLPYPISLPPLPSSLSCRGRNFFGFFIFGCFLSILLILPAHPTPTGSNLVCNGRVCIFSRYDMAESWGLVAAHWQLSGLQVASLHMRNALNAFVFISSFSSSSSSAQLIPL